MASLYVELVKFKTILRNQRFILNIYQKCWPISQGSWLRWSNAFSNDHYLPAARIFQQLRGSDQKAARVKLYHLQTTNSLQGDLTIWFSCIINLKKGLQGSKNKTVNIDNASSDGSESIKLLWVGGGWYEVNLSTGPRYSTTLINYFQSWQMFYDRVTAAS